METKFVARPSALAINVARSCYVLLEVLKSHGSLDSVPKEARATLEQWADGQGSSHNSSSSLLQTLGQLIAIPQLSEAVATHFRPLLPDLASRLPALLLANVAGWTATETKTTLYVLAKLLLPFPEVYPHVLHFLSSPTLRSHPCHPQLSKNKDDLSRLLLSFARLLYAAPPLVSLVSEQLPSAALQSVYTNGEAFDSATRLLAIRIVATLNNLSEQLREKLETRFVGNVSLTSMSQQAQNQLRYTLDGSSNEVDAELLFDTPFAEHIDVWTLPFQEVQRRQKVLRQSQANPIEYLDEEAVASGNSPFQSSDLRLEVADIAGVLHFRGHRGTSAILPSPRTSFVVSRKQQPSLNCLAQALQQNVPVLLSGPPSSGKSCLLSYLCSLLHPTASDSESPLVTLQLGDHSSLDAKTLVGSYTSSTRNAGTFEWVDGALTRAVRDGKWLVLKDIDRATGETLSILKPLVEVLSPFKQIGALPELDLGVRGKVRAGSTFRIFAIRSITPLTNSSGGFSYPAPLFLGSKHWAQVDLPPLEVSDIANILQGCFPRLTSQATEDQLLQKMVSVWAEIVDTASSLSRIGGKAPLGSTRVPSLRDLMKWCRRVEPLCGASGGLSILSDQRKRDRTFLEGVDVFLASSPSLKSHSQDLNSAAWLAANLPLQILASTFDIPAERAMFKAVGEQRSISIKGGRDILDPSGSRSAAMQVGRFELTRKQVTDAFLNSTFAETQPTKLLLECIAGCVALSEPTLLVGETGTGKTTTVQYLASQLGIDLVTLNLSQQTESSDLLGSFKPLEPRVPAAELHNVWYDLFEATFCARRNARFVDLERKALQGGRWSRLVVLWKESIRMANERRERKMKQLDEARRGDATIADGDSAKTAKKRRTERGSTFASASALEEGMERENSMHRSWQLFDAQVSDFAGQHATKKRNFVFSFIEGPLIKALRDGSWVLLDEINLAASETLDSLASLLATPDSSLTLFERGDIKPVPRHRDFRLFACMNPATDVGKKDLPPNLRARFTEVYVQSPDADFQALRQIVEKYIGHLARGERDQSTIQDVAECYRAIRKLAEDHLLADGANQRPHFSIRTLARALTFAADQAAQYGLRRALWEGFVMVFTLLLEGRSARMVKEILDRLLISKAKNSEQIARFVPTRPHEGDKFSHVQIGSFWLQTGPHALDTATEYILTPSVQTKLIGLARAILARKSPILIQGPTSAGKTSALEYLARRTGHRFVRINNHEHTDVQEYLGSYASDPDTGRLVFHEGLLVKALRSGDWIVLDELNLAPTDVLEALNRLLDDNRELVIPETGEIVRPHPHFMLFATQNPPGLYAGRKILSRAFRNRFIEMHFDNVPQPELETILTNRCEIPPSYAAKIVAVFIELQRRRQAGRVFDAKHEFVTLRDLFRWGQRDALGYQQLAENGYMLIAERVRRSDDKAVVKEVIEDIMHVQIDESALYDLRGSGRRIVADRLGSDLSDAIVAACGRSGIVWTAAMSRLLCLVALCLRYNEPVLLVGETGAGKTSVCEVLAQAMGCQLFSINCHQNTDTADLLGGQRPLRNRASLQSLAKADALALLSEWSSAGLIPPLTLPHAVDLESLSAILAKAFTQVKGDASREKEVQAVVQRINQASALFEWRDGPLVEAMRSGSHLLLDEISLADDSVLERINSVLEPGRTLVLAEKSCSSSKPVEALDEAQIFAATGFEVFATMNPGGDYGKKELSPALRNRFTEIWVPQVDDTNDILAIFAAKWAGPELHRFGPKILSFVNWFASQLGSQDQAGISLRDLLAWVTFINSTVTAGTLGPESAFAHGAMLVIVDGIGATSSTTSMTATSLNVLRDKCYSKIRELVDTALPDDVFHPSDRPLIRSDKDSFAIGPFAIQKGSTSEGDAVGADFSFQASTTAFNALKVLRALYVPNKAILLEGSPGAGKTSLIGALARASNNALTRINLSDQTELIDLFGADLPVEGGGPGEFAWRDAAFLRAMQNGEWVLLDEMNLASQSVLEGLNSCLDHRGSVFISELSRSFDKHPSFRLFAAQNPQAQGGGRKGLPKSFMNRFTKVNIEELKATDILTICAHLYPSFPRRDLDCMIRFNAAVHDEVMVRHSFGRHGAPWEFNLRDLLRWLAMIHSDLGLNWTHRPIDHLAALYLQRFRSKVDQHAAAAIFERIFGTSVEPDARPWLCLTPHYAQFGHALLVRNGTRLSDVQHQRLAISSRHLPALEAMSACVQLKWLAIIVGPSGSGKTALVRLLAHLAGAPLEEMRMNSGIDTMDVLGTFEQIDPQRQIREKLQQTVHFLEQLRAVVLLNKTGSNAWHEAFSTVSAGLSALTHGTWNQECLENIVTTLLALMECPLLLPNHRSSLSHLLGRVRDSDPSQQRVAGRFEWHNGPLLRAMRQGSWLLLDDANLCSASVLDRLNSLCEPGGELILSERGVIDGAIPTLKPHKNFRLFMALDPQHGELSRAMRNRGLEIYVPSSDDARESLESLAPFADRPACEKDLRSVLFSESTLASAMQARDLIAQSVSDGRRDMAADMFSASAVPPGIVHLLSHLVHGPERDLVVQLSTYLQKIGAAQSAHRVRLEWNQAHGIDKAFMASQPLDIGANPLLYSAGMASSQNLRSGLRLACAGLVLERLFSGIQEAETGKVLDILQRAAKLALRRFGTGMEIMCYDDPEYQELVSLLKFAQSLRATVTLMAFSPMASAQTHTTLCEMVQQIIFLLQRCAGQVAFDYSLAHTILNEVQELRQNLDAIDSTITAGWPALSHHSASLVTGHAMRPIWELSMPLCAFTDAALPASRLRRQLQVLSRGEHDHSLLNSAVELGATLGLSDSSWTLQQKEEVLSLVAELSDQMSRPHTSPYVGQEAASPRWEIPILAQLQMLLSNPEHAGDTTRAAVSEFIKQSIESSSYPLENSIAVKRRSWLLDSGKSTEQVSLSDLFTWVQPVLDSSGLDELLQPFMLQNVILPSNASRVSLAGLAEHRRQCSKMARALSASSVDSGVSRHIALRNELLRLTRLLIPTLEYYAEQANQLVAIRRCIEDLKVVKRGLETSVKENRGDTGRAYIRVASTLLRLYLPNVALDPLALLRTREAFAEAQLQDAMRQEALWASLEQSVTDCAHGPMVKALHERVEEARKALMAAQVKTAVDRLPDVARLTKFFGDIQAFTSQMLDAKKVDDLQRCILSEAGLDKRALAREASLQNSLQSLRHKLRVEFSDLQDLCVPLERVVDLFQIGFRTLLWSQSHCQASLRERRHAKLVDALVQFPSTRAHEAFRVSELPLRIKQGTIDSPMAAPMLLAVVSFIAQDIQDRKSHGALLKTLSRTYDQLFFLWNADREREAQAAIEDNSLFKSRNNVSIDDLDDDEAFEAEFRTLFPDFADILDADGSCSTPADAGNKDSPCALLQPAHQIDLCSLHLNIFKVNQSPAAKSHLGSSLNRRRELVRSLLRRSYGRGMSEELDSSSRAFQLSLLSREAGFMADTYESASPNFYLDPNLEETGKATNIVLDMRNRLSQLICEWPEQMVLQHLKDRCDAILDLDSASPVAKILAALEQLLVHSEDWEGYAMSKNSLAAFRTKISDQIIAWRRLELSGWSHLLEAQARRYCASVGEWWFRIYKVAIRGMQSAMAESECKGTEHLRSLVGLLDQFIRSSTLGDFAARLDLLRAFGRYLGLLFSHAPTVDASGLDRVGYVFGNVAAFYGQFSEHIADILGKQRDKIEQEIRSFILLASWKDVNIYALKQSAQKTHCRLHKSIRQFRDVLRQPVDPVLASVSDAKQQHAQLPTDIADAQTLPHPSWSAAELASCRETLKKGASLTFDDRPLYLQNLAKTFDVLCQKIDQSLAKIISAVQAERIDDLAVVIVTRSRELAKATPALAKEDNQKAIKSLTNQKRKAWTDLLKELRRLGLSPYINPEVSQRNQDASFVYEQPRLFHGVSVEPSEELDRYLYRLLSLMPQMRSSLYNSQRDVGIAELQRGASFCEHALSIVLSERARLSALQRNMNALQAIEQRLSVIRSPSVQLERCATGQANQVDGLFQLTGRIISALQEINDECLAHTRLSPFSSQGLDAFRRQLEETKDKLLVASQSLPGLNEALRCTHEAFWTRDERELVQQCLSNLDKIAIQLSDASSSLPALKSLCLPTIDWIKEQSQDLRRLQAPPEVDPSSVVSYNSQGYDRLISFILLVAQNLESKCSALTDRTTDDLCDKAILVDLDQLQTTGQEIRLSEVSEQVRNCLHAASPLHPAESFENSVSQMRRIVPFVSAYKRLLASHFGASVRWQRSVLKLTYVLASTVKSLSLHGFCKPPEQDTSQNAEASGEDQDLKGGTGLGDGSGAKDITDQLDEDENIEELRKDDDDDVNSDGKGETQREKNALEAEDDINGKLEEISVDEGDNDAEKQDTNQEEPDDHVGDVDPLDPNSVDEKVWSGDRKDEGQNQEQSGKDETKKDIEGHEGQEDSVAKYDADRNDKTSKEKAVESREETQDAGHQSDDDDKRQLQDGEEADNEQPEDDGEIQSEENLGKSEDTRARQLDETVNECENLDIDDDLKMSEQEDQGSEAFEDLGDLDLPEENEPDVEMQNQDLSGELDPDERLQKTDVNFDDPGPDEYSQSAGEANCNAGEDAMDENEDEEDADNAAQMDRTSEERGLDAQSINGRDAQFAEPESDPVSDFHATEQISASAEQKKGARVQQGRRAQRSEHTNEQGDITQNEDSEAEHDPDSSNTGQNARNASAGNRAEQATDQAYQQKWQSDATDESETNPIRSLGDALKEFRRKLDSISEASTTEHPNPEGRSFPEGGDVEHVVEHEDEDTEMQAIGAAENEDVRQTIPEQQQSLQDEVDEKAGNARPDASEETEQEMQSSVLKLEPMPLPSFDDINQHAAREQQRDATQNKALLPADVQSAQQDCRPLQPGVNEDPELPVLEEVNLLEEKEMEEHIDLALEADCERADQALEEELADFRVTSDDGDRLVKANNLWRSYSAMTSGLAFALCEQLRLILSPTLAARLNGDFRTGKRLNMRKIVPFIASDFAKDKIWLRRTKPSKREYQVLLALDDSRSMAENRSVHLAYQTLALVTGALNRLEVGDVSICRFGEQVKTLHPFGRGVLGDRNGAQILSELSFKQKSTNMVRLVEYTLNSLQEARQSRPISSGSSAADLWQLEIVISDGVCQADDFERLRALLRRANEERVMIVFVIVDSLQQRANSSSSRNRSAAEISLLSMQSISYEVDSVTGRLDMRMERYMDQFPFSHYIILREAEALPEVLATTLRQWAEKIREAE